MMKLSNQEIAALHRIENKKAFYGDPLILTKMYRRLEAENDALRNYADHFETCAKKLTATDIDKAIESYAYPDKVRMRVALFDLESMLKAKERNNEY